MSFLLTTFVPGIPDSILTDTSDESVTDRHIAGKGDFVEVSNPILAGVSGTVHIGMDKDLITLKGSTRNRAAGLSHCNDICGWHRIGNLVNQSRARPLSSLLTYAVELARNPGADVEVDTKVLDRSDEVGHLARLYLHFSTLVDTDKARGAPAVE